MPSAPFTVSAGVVVVVVGVCYSGARGRIAVRPVGVATACTRPPARPTRRDVDAPQCCDAIFFCCAITRRAFLLPSTNIDEISAADGKGPYISKGFDAPDANDTSARKMITAILFIQAAALTAATSNRWRGKEGGCHFKLALITTLHVWRIVQHIYTHIALLTNTMSYMIIIVVLLLLVRVCVCECAEALQNARPA